MNQTETAAGLIDEERLKKLLIELIKIDSLSRKERDVAMRLKQEMEELGATVMIDNAGEKVGGNVGNLIAYFPGERPAAEPLLLSAHMLGEPVANCNECGWPVLVGSSCPRCDYAKEGGI